MSVMLQGILRRTRLISNPKKFKVGGGGKAEYLHEVVEAFKAHLLILGRFAMEHDMSEKNRYITKWEQRVAELEQAVAEAHKEGHMEGYKECPPIIILEGLPAMDTPYGPTPSRAGVDNNNNDYYDDNYHDDNNYNDEDNYNNDNYNDDDNNQPPHNNTPSPYCSPILSHSNTTRSPSPPRSPHRNDNDNHPPHNNNNHPPSPSRTPSHSLSLSRTPPSSTSPLRYSPLRYSHLSPPPHPLRHHQRAPDLFRATLSFRLAHARRQLHRESEALISELRSRAAECAHDLRDGARDHEDEVRAEVAGWQEDEGRSLDQRGRGRWRWGGRVEWGDWGRVEGEGARLVGELWGEVEGSVRKVRGWAGWRGREIGRDMRERLRVRVRLYERRRRGRGRGRRVSGRVMRYSERDENELFVAIDREVDQALRRMNTIAAGETAKMLRRMDDKIRRLEAKRDRVLEEMDRRVDEEVSRFERPQAEDRLVGE
ncbi:hypothetical protein F5144DRAFT_625706 [Chaetomium tenue]|uniref:Uncharacterized protein n=1 Tax=Chaetomium tenue TaxID=1854479 RepID=A0ACB7PNA0_9PEZI|nr:hypothetical protein F5144DRAFT_625706 [Chaetomium globosum]